MANDWWTDARELLLGGACPGCGNPGWQLCEQCQSILFTKPHLVGRPWEDLPTTYACAPYEGVAHNVIVAAKEQGVWRATKDLAQALSLAVAACALHVNADLPLVLIPIPSSAQNVRQRGLDVTAQIARQTVEKLKKMHIPAQVEPCLRLSRAVADQAQLNAQARRQNLSGAITCRHAPSPGGIILVDDIITTGSTLLAGVEAVNKTGSQVLGCACVAAAGWK